MLKSAVFFLIFSLAAQAATLKVAIIAPKNSTWGKTLMAINKRLKKATQGKVKLKVYYGGVAGDEPDILRKIRIGQLHGGLFTGRALGDINPHVRIVEVPFTFGHNRKMAWEFVKESEAEFDRGFEKSGFSNLGFFEIGLVYMVSVKKAASLQEFQRLKIWAWQGDPLVPPIIETMKLVAVPLALPDVLSSLSTGIIEAAYAPAMGLVALQWNTKIKYLFDYPFAFSLGAFVIGQKQKSKLSLDHQKMLDQISKEEILKANKKTHQENQKALALIKQSVEVVPLQEGDVIYGIETRRKVLKKLTNKLFTPELVSRVEKKIKGKERQNARLSAKN